MTEGFVSTYGTADIINTLWNSRPKSTDCR